MPAGLIVYALYIEKYEEIGLTFAYFAIFIPVFGKATVNAIRCPIALLTVILASYKDEM